MDPLSVKQELEQTIERHESYAALDPENHLLWLTLGDLYHRVSRLDDALEAYGKAARLAQDSAVPQGRIASVLITQHRFDEAGQRLRELLDAGEEDPALRYNLGIALFYQKDFEEALRTFESAREAGADPAICSHYRARCLHQLGRMDDALASCRDWLSAAGGAEAKGYLSLLELDNDDTAAARRTAQEVLAESPENEDAQLVMGLSSVELHEIEDAVRHLEQVIARNPAHPRAWLGRGLVHLYEGEHDRAMAAFERAIRIMPDDLGAYVALGWTKNTVHDFAGAERVFRDALKVDRNFAESHGGLAFALAMQARVDEANEEIKQALWLDPMSFGAGAARSVVIGVQGDPERSKRLLAAMLDHKPAADQPSLLEHIERYITRKQSAPPSGPGTEDGTS